MAQISGGIGIISFPCRADWLNLRAEEEMKIDLTDDERLLIDKYRELKEGIFGSLSVEL